MAEANGTARLDRMERILEMFIADHQQMRQEHELFQQEHSQLLKAQVLQADQLIKNSEQITALAKV